MAIALDPLILNAAQQAANSAKAQQPALPVTLPIMLSKMAAVLNVQMEKIIV